MRNTILVLFFLVGCSTPKQQAVEPPPPASEQCAANQFVACTSGEDCTRTRGKHLHQHACHDHAATACDALGCKRGCDIHHGPIGEPADVFCALDDASSKNTWRCGGYSGWACPEDMTCELEKPHGFDVTGKCVPKSGAAN